VIVQLYLNSDTTEEVHVEPNKCAILHMMWHITGKGGS